MCGVIGVASSGRRGEATPRGRLGMLMVNFYGNSDRAPSPLFSRYVGNGGVPGAVRYAKMG